MSKDNLGDRMKDYENSYRIHLPKRMPIMIRIDGCHFHTYTKSMKKPFDEKLMNAFWETTKYICSNIMGVKLAYSQSDEITLLLTNYEKLTTQSWFDNNLQKIASVTASLFTAKFNDEIKKVYPEKGLATFDARAWVLPKEEVVNAFIWRQNDATKNSISMVAQSNFPHKELQSLNSSQLQDKLFLEKNVNWNDLPVWQKRGVCIKKEEYQKAVEDGNFATRTHWVVDEETPIFTKNQDYINKYVF